MSAPFNPDAPVKLGASKPLFAPGLLFGMSLGLGREQQYAVSPDGQRFLMNLPAGQNSMSPITVLLNWQSRLRH